MGKQLDRERTTRCLFVATVPIAMALVIALGGQVQAADYEIPHNVHVKEILHADVIQGPHYHIEDTVVTYDGYMNHYTVASDYGPFEVTGDAALRKLILEIHAIAELKEVKKSKVFLDSLVLAAKRPVNVGKNLILHPVDTLTGIPKGVGTLFGNIAKGIKGTVSGTHDPSEDNRAEQALQMSAYKREWAYKLGVDPYSSNKVLQKDLNSVGWAGALGSLSVTAVTFPAQSTVMTALKMARLSDQMTEIAEQRNEFGERINKMVETLPPSRMRLTNEEKLAKMGIPADLAKQYLDHPHFTPRHDAIIVNSLEALQGTKGVELFFQIAIYADDEESANFFQNKAEMLRGYHQTEAPIRELRLMSDFLMAKDKNGTMVIAQPLDRGVWRKPIDQLTRELMAMQPTQGSAGNMTIWLTGTASPLALQKFKARGITVVQNVDTRIHMMD